MSLKEPQKFNIHDKLKENGESEENIKKILSNATPSQFYATRRGPYPWELKFRYGDGKEVIIAIVDDGNYQDRISVVWDDYSRELFGNTEIEIPFNVEELFRDIPKSEQAEMLRQFETIDVQTNFVRLRDSVNFRFRSRHSPYTKCLIHCGTYNTRPQALEVRDSIRAQIIDYRKKLGLK